MARQAHWIRAAALLAALSGAALAGSAQAGGAAGPHITHHAPGVIGMAPERLGTLPLVNASGYDWRYYHRPYPRRFYGGHVYRYPKGHRRPVRRHRHYYHRPGRVVRAGPCTVRIVRPTPTGRVIRVIDVCR